VVKKNEYPRKSNFSKDGERASEPIHSNSPQKTFQKDGEFHQKENNTRNNRPPRENQQSGSNQPREYQQRDNQKRENNPKDNQLRENVQRDSAPRENVQRDSAPRENVQRDSAPRDNVQRDNAPRDNHQRNYYRDNTPNRDGFRDTREPYRQHNQRPAIKPRSEESVEDIANDINIIEKEIELELKEIKSMRLGL